MTAIKDLNIHVEKNKQEDQTWQVFFDELASHVITPQEIQNIHSYTNQLLKATDYDSTVATGKKLFELLNGSSGILQQKLAQAGVDGKRLGLNISFDPELCRLPWELLFDTQFLGLQVQTPIIRKVRGCTLIPNSYQPQQRRLRILFMACSPLDLHHHEVNNFVDEENRILKQTENLPIYLKIDDSGTLNGLTKTLQAIQSPNNSSGEKQFFDIIQLSAHAGIDQELGPVIYMEDDSGGSHKVNAKMLWQAVEKNLPQILFLSGCSTGQQDTSPGFEQELFVQELIQLGIPSVITWNLPITVNSGTAVAGYIYNALCSSLPLDRAVQTTRNELQQYINIWPFLKLFNSSNSYNPLILPASSGSTVENNGKDGDCTYNPQSNATEMAFIARRRELQHGGAVLKGRIPDKHGLLITGTNGTGKSSLSEVLIGRIDHRNIISFSGEFDKKILLWELHQLFNQQELTHEVSILQSRQTYHARIKKLFSELATKSPILLYFDNFEQNLQTSDNGQWAITPTCREAIFPLIADIDLAEGNIQIIISSRYPFMLEESEEDLMTEHFAHISLGDFQTPDLMKLVNNGNINLLGRSKHRQLYLTISGGNPQILNRLNVLAGYEDRFHPEKLQIVFAQQPQDSLNTYLTNLIIQIQGQEFSDYFRQVSVHRIPVPELAYAPFGSKNYLSIGVTLGLFKVIKSSIRKEFLYQVCPSIRLDQYNQLTVTNQREAHNFALDWYMQRLAEREEEKNYYYLEEALYHGLNCGRMREVCKYAVVLANYYQHMSLDNEYQSHLLTISAYLDDAIVDEAIKEKDIGPSAVFNKLAHLSIKQKEYEKATNLFEKSIAIDRKIYGENHLNIGNGYYNLGSILIDQGKYEQALDYYQKALTIWHEIHGEIHPQMAAIHNNCGAAWNNLQEYEKAITSYQQALQIDQQLFGENHPETAIDYTNLGTALDNCEEYQKAIEFFQKAQDIWVKTYGDNHPMIASGYNALGFAYKGLGDYQKALDFYQRALKVDIAVSGENHLNTAIRYNNIAAAWKALNDNQQAIDFLQKALTICTSVLGPNHPNTVNIKNNIENLEAA